MNPIRQGDGTGLSAAGFSEVRKGDGTVLSAAGPGIPDSGVARWEFEQDVTDSWGTYDGTDNTSAGYTTDPAVGAYAKSFDGNDDYVNIGDFSVFTTPPFSVALYIRTSLSDSNFDGSQRPFTKSNDGGGFAGWFFLGDIIDQDGNLVFQANGDSNSGFRVSSTTAINDGNWHQAVVTYSASNTEAILYIDGSSEDTNSNFNPGNISNPAELTFGSRNAGADRFYEGDVDDARFYDKVLTSTEVSNLYNTGSING